MDPDLDATDLYARLGVSRGASQEEVKRAYVTLVKRYTPELAPEEFKRIREAYETLSDPERRREYDKALPPALQKLVDAAGQAMRVHDYPKAEQSYKQVLVEMPDLHWVRNLLGLCFIYQGNAAMAVTQYERLLREKTLDAATRGNAAQAYRMAKRLPEAEREYRAAMNASEGEQKLHFGLELIATIGERNLVAADKEAVAQLDGMAPGGPEAIEYGAKRLEITALLGWRDHIQPRLAQVVRGVTTDEQKERAATAMGRVAWRLFRYQLFVHALPIARAAKQLCPADANYDGLETASSLLCNFDFDGARRLLFTHVAFAAPGYWLGGLAQTIREYCESHAVFKGMRRVETVPTVRTFYGIGPRIYGKRDRDELTNTHVVTLYFTAFFVPLFPLSCYRVRIGDNGLRYFLARVPYARRDRLHWWAFGVALVALFVWGRLGAGTTAGGDSALVPTSDTVAAESTTFAPAPDAAAIYEGEAVNTTDTTLQIRAPMRLVLTSWHGRPNGRVELLPPLGGTGMCQVRARGDSVLIGSISGVGDTIAWVGAWNGDALRGQYVITGGRFAKQHGTWWVARARGRPIPRQLNPW